MLSLIARTCNRCLGHQRLQCSNQQQHLTAINYISCTHRYPGPYKNDAEGAAANGGALPPDLTLMTKARENGVDYVFALLTGYADSPAGKDLLKGLYYNPYFTGGAIAMPPPLMDGQVEYEDGTPATVTQMAKPSLSLATTSACAGHRSSLERSPTWTKRSAAAAAATTAAVIADRCCHCSCNGCLQYARSSSTSSSCAQQRALCVVQSMVQSSLLRRVRKQRVDVTRQCAEQCSMQQQQQYSRCLKECCCSRVVSATLLVRAVWGWGAW
eukprot:20421-Heterococcus_DN1.PRE.6